MSRGIVRRDRLSSNLVHAGGTLIARPGPTSGGASHNSEVKATSAKEITRPPGGTEMPPCHQKRCANSVIHPYPHEDREKLTKREMKYQHHTPQVVSTTVTNLCTYHLPRDPGTTQHPKRLCLPLNWLPYGPDIVLIPSLLCVLMAPFRPASGLSTRSKRNITDIPDFRATLARTIGVSNRKR